MGGEQGREECECARSAVPQMVRGVLVESALLPVSHQESMMSGGRSLWRAMKMALWSWDP
eukprot:1150937-Rhodomonas_salina.3